jgi:FkbH-like protein
VPSILALPWLTAPPADFSAQCRAIEAAAAGSAGAAIQRLALSQLSLRQSTALSRAIKRCLAAKAGVAPLSTFRLGVLASATADLLLDCIPAAAARHGVAVDLVSAPYDQVMQQALDPNSAINAAALDAVLIAVDHRWLNLDRPNLQDAAAQVRAATDRLRAVVDALRQNGNAPAIMQTLPAPPERLFGSFDRRVGGSVRMMIDEVNRTIAAIADETGSYVLDVAAIAEQIGTDTWFDPVQWWGYKFPFAAECVPVYADMMGRLLGAIRGKVRKCLVLDLDNTIWGGVIGDDGIEGIQVGQGHPRGEAFLAVQRAALELRDRGIILAVCSKNDDAVARAAFRDHPDMLLRESHIAAFHANWTDKPSNLEAIAKALNIGLDALVFFDDNPAERAQVRAALPMVAVPELPEDPGLFAWYMTAPGYFEAVAFSAEDRLRAESYASDLKRAEVLGKARDLGDYLNSLDMVITFAPFDVKGRQRIVQLINKTNQFNLTTRRYTEAEVVAMEADKSVFTLQVRLADKFGDLGMIGVVICRPSAKDRATWEVDTWLMSCRVLGRQVEQAMLSKVRDEAQKAGVRRVVGTYIPTAKNGMVADHYGKLGFRQIDAADAPQIRWDLAIDESPALKLPMRVDDRWAPALAAN